MSRKKAHKNRSNGRLGSVAALTAAALVAPFWVEESVAMEARDPFADLAPVSDAELQNMRGGFISRSGMRLDFGIEMRTMVDGIERLRTSLRFRGNRVTTTRTSFVPPDVDGDSKSEVENPGGVPVPHIQTTADDLQTLIQNGVGNSVGTSGDDITELGISGIANIIQNTVDGAIIQHLTTVDLTVFDSAAAIRANNLLGGLNLHKSGLGL